MSQHADRQLGDLVTEEPRYARVFESFDIDYCCGGDETLAEACETEGVNIAAVRDALTEVESDSESDDEWETLGELVDHIIETHHEYLREELHELESLVDTVSRVHSENHPELQDVADIVPELTDEMHDHIREEEEGGFPIIQRLDDGASLLDEDIATLRAELDHYETDHDETAERLEEIAELTNGYEVPDDACPSYRSMLARLEELEADTHMHVHKENNILFPQAESMLEETVQ
jgi:regulator of cell morphogenesis and NO signaling